MLERQAKSSWAKAAFFERYNDVDVYVEDSSKEAKKLYSSLISRALGGRVRIDCVFPLGGRDKVLAACQDDQGAGGRRRVYIVDADLDLCKCIAAPSLKRFYRLPRYCVENFLIDERAVATVLARESEEKDETTIALELQFDAWLDGNAGALRRLFLAYGSTHRLEPSVRCVSISYTSLLSDDSGFVDPLKVEGVIVDLRRQVDARREPGSFDAAFDELERTHAMKSDRDFLLHFVSGKDYLLPLLRLRMNRIVRIAKSFALLKVNLAAETDANELSDVDAYLE